MGDVIGGFLVIAILGILVGIWNTVLVIDTTTIQHKALCENTSITIKEYKTCMDLSQDELLKQLPKIKYK